MCDILPNIVHDNDCKPVIIYTNKNSHNFLTFTDRTLILLLLFFIFCYVLLTAANCVLITFYHNFGCRYLLLQSPWYNRTGWLGVKHQLTYLPTFTSISSLVMHHLLPMCPVKRLDWYFEGQVHIKVWTFQWVFVLVAFSELLKLL